MKWTISSVSFSLVMGISSDSMGMYGMPVGHVMASDYLFSLAFSLPPTAGASCVGSAYYPTLANYAK